MPKARILAVDDDPATLKLIERILTADDYEVVTAESGTEALNRVKNENVDLVILDLMIPGIEGLGVSRMLKFDTKYMDIPIIILTGLEQEQYEKLGYKTGADRFFKKPIDAKTLLSAIAKLLPKNSQTTPTY